MITMMKVSIIQNLMVAEKQNLITEQKKMVRLHVTVFGLIFLILNLV